MCTRMQCQQADSAAVSYIDHSHRSRLRLQLLTVIIPDSFILAARSAAALGNLRCGGQRAAEPASVLSVRVCATFQKTDCIPYVFLNGPSFSRSFSARSFIFQAIVFPLCIFRKMTQYFIVIAMLRGLLLRSKSESGGIE